MRILEREVRGNNPWVFRLANRTSGSKGLAISLALGRICLPVEAGSAA